MRKTAIFITLSAALFMGLDRLYHPKGLRFAPSKITTSYESPEWELPPLSSEDQKAIDGILSQKFTYFDKGSQTYVFISEDKKYVLKFLKQGKLYPTTWLAYIPFSFNPYSKQVPLFREKRWRTYNAEKIAFTQFKHETGLLYVHLNRTRNLNKKISLTDKKGKVHTVSLDNTSFFIQKKADLIYPRIAELMEQKNVARAKKAIASLFSLIDEMNKRGVVDNDPIIRKNFGFLDDRAIQFDTGRMRIDPARVHDTANTTKKFRQWIEETYPELLGE